MRRYSKPLLGFLVFLILFALSGFYILPPLVKNLLVEKLSKTLHRQAAIEELEINPFTLAVTARGFSLKDRDVAETFLSFDELRINLEVLSILKRALILKELVIVKPCVRIIRNRDGTYNFSDLMEKEEPKPELEKPPLRFAISDIRIVDGSLEFWDGPKRTKHRAKDIRIAVPFISNFPHYSESFVRPSFSADINGNAWSVEGATKPFADSLETRVDFDIRDLNIPKYLVYVPAKLNFKLLSALLDARGRIAFIQRKEGDPSLVLSGEVRLKEFAVDDRLDRPLVRLPALGVSMDAVEPLKGIIRLSKVSLSSPEIVLRRDKQGKINLASLTGDEKREETAPERAGKEKAGALQLAVDHLVIDSGKVSYEDERPPRAVALGLKDIRLTAENISTVKGTKGNLDLAFRFEKRGAVNVKGPFVVDPLSADLFADVRGIPIRPFQSYFDDKVKIAVARGDLSLKGNLSLSDEGKTGLKAAYKGNAMISNFASIDKRHADDFLKWKSLFFDAIRAGYNPLSLNIGGIALTDFYARIIINEDKSLNLQDIFEQEAQPEPSEPARPHREETAAGEAQRSERNVKIGTITLQGGTIEFEDRWIRPRYGAKLVEIGGSISGLSSEEKALADVELRGKLDRYAPIEIVGKINPLREDLYVDLKSSFKDMDLNPVTPYAGKYLGYTIEKGKLFFDLEYHIVGRKLDSQNNIFIDQLTLGEKVESPEATNLPVSLAIALLKDRNGQIKIEIPVTGSLDQPEFSVWRIIVQVLVNLLTKAAAAPFSLLGSLFGEGEEFSYVEFDHGSADVSEPNVKKLKTLAKALAERPSLRLDLEGYADVEKDRAVLKRHRFDKLLKVQKLKDLIDKGLPALPVDEVRIETQEYEKYLKKAYEAGKFPKPRDAAGRRKELPVPEMEKLLFAHTAISDDDLRALVSRRVMKVKDVLLESGEVAPERVFVSTKGTLSPEKKESIRDSRLEFKLRAN